MNFIVTGHDCKVHMEKSTPLVCGIIAALGVAGELPDASQWVLKDMSGNMIHDWERTVGQCGFALHATFYLNRPAGVHA